MLDLEKIITYYRESADRDWGVADQLLELKRYSYALFFCHLAIEKTLKGIIVQKTKEAAPYSHDLAKLSEIASIEVDEKMLASLNEITKFNISGRYDDQKLAFYNKATKEFTEKYFKISEEIYLWLKKNYLKK